MYVRVVTRHDGKGEFAVSLCFGFRDAVAVMQGSDEWSCLASGKGGSGTGNGEWRLKALTNIYTSNESREIESARGDSAFLQS
jgi:hypothetical protein